MREYVEEKSENRLPAYVSWTINFKHKENDKDKVLLVISRCPDGCMSTWVKNGYVKEFFAWWHITVYATDDKGYCWGRYNPQEKPEIKRVKFGLIIMLSILIGFCLPLKKTDRK